MYPNIFVTPFLVFLFFSSLNRPSTLERRNKRTKQGNTFREPEKGREKKRSYTKEGKIWHKKGKTFLYLKQARQNFSSFVELRTGGKTGQQQKDQLKKKKKRTKLFLNLKEGNKKRATIIYQKEKKKRVTKKRVGVKKVEKYSNKQSKKKKLYQGSKKSI